jgi:putative ABC transport system substrate-binding protein
MVTGITNLASDLSEKLIELLVEVVPKLKRVGVLIYGNVPDRSLWLDPARRSAARYGVEVHVAYPTKADEIDTAISDLAKRKVEALVVFPHPFLAAQRTRIMALGQGQRWPLVGLSRTWVEHGALLSYGVDSVQNYRRAAYFVDRILKGAKPGDLPIEQPMTFEMAVNMKTAKALGLTIPPTIAVRATHVVQ